MQQGKLFWVIWLLLGCQMAWMTARAVRMPWRWNPYQCLTVVFLCGLCVLLAWLGWMLTREGLGGIRNRMAAFEREIETPKSRIGFRWNLGFWIVAGVLAAAYYQMEQG